MLHDHNGFVTSKPISAAHRTLSSITAKCRLHWVPWRHYRSTVIDRLCRSDISICYFNDLLSQWRVPVGRSLTYLSGYSSSICSIPYSNASVTFFKKKILCLIALSLRASYVAQRGPHLMTAHEIVGSILDGDSDGVSISRFLHPSPILTWILEE